MKQNRKFALSTIALLIQSALCFEANAAEYEVENVEYVSLQPDPQRLGSVSTWKGGKITVKQTILPYWQKGETRRKLEVITTGNGADGNLLVNGIYGIQSFADPQLGYAPELLVKSNNDIIFNNNFQSVDVHPYSENIHLDAKGKIQFNLNVADKVTDPITKKTLENNSALVRYVNTITPPPPDEKNDKGSISFHSKTGNLFNMNVNIHKDTRHYGIHNLRNTDVHLTAEDGDNVIAIKGELADPMPAGNVESTSFLRGIETAFKSNTVLTGNNNKVSITTEGDGLGLGVEGLNSKSPYSGHTTGIFVNNQSSNLTQPSLDGVSTIELKAVKGNNEVDLNVKNHASVKGILASHSATATLEAEGDNIIRVKNPDTGAALIDALKTQYPNASKELYRIGVQSTTDSDVVLNAANNIVEVGGNPMNQEGIAVHGNATITLKAKENNKITVENAAYSSDGISTLTNREGARPGTRDDGNKIILEAGGDNIVTIKSGDADADYVNNSDILKGTDSYKYKRGSNGIFSYGDKSLVKLVGNNNIVKSEISEKSKALNGGFNHNGIYSWKNAKVELSAKNDNIVQGGIRGLFSNNSSISLEGKNNAISNPKYNVFAYNKAKVDLTAENKNTLSDAEFGVYAREESTVNLSSKDKNEVKSTKIGLYSEDGGLINVDGKDNIIEGDSVALVGMNGNLSIRASSANRISSKSLGIYAKDSAKIALTGESNTIRVRDAAIHSLDKSEVSIDGRITIHSGVANVARNGNSLINLKYKDNSSINGATVSDGGNVSITPLNNSDVNVMSLTGDALAVNKGKVELDFTPNSRLVGRLDNFSGLNNPKHKDLFKKYVNELDSKSAGVINLNLAKDALWTMTGQSWLDKLSGEGTVDFDSNSKTSGRALHIGELAGANKFLMHLNKDGVHSDMLYVKKGTSTPQEVVVKNLSEVLDSMNYGDRLRFATVTDSKNEFVNGKKYIDDTHLLEQALTVEYSDHKTDPSNNEDYNRRFNGETMTAEKAGNTDVDTMYGSEHRKNVYLVKQATGNPSRNVKNINDMFDSTAHYAFTLDTYTKREGERAFSTLDKKEGDWIRLTHTRLIQSNAFRFHNNDFEIGYDRFSLNEQEKKRKWGISFDYGHGRTSLWNTFGKGKIRKYELALYNTTQYIDKEGDETGYIDNVLKIGKLRNRVIARNHMGQLWGEGKYSNTLFSISTEYGRRKFLDDDKLWRITPQVQLQYSYLRGAGYRLDNGINVNLSHVNSLIGRLGLDVVRKFDEGKKLFYIKGNILHEFLGSRSFKAFEGNSKYTQKWNTRGTWYSVGLGYNARTGKKTNVFADAEKEFSGGKKGSYNIRLSVSHQFD